MKTNFLGQAYSSRSPILSSQTAINLYPEGTEGNSDEVGAYYGTPGLVSKFQDVIGEVRGLHACNNRLYAVIKNNVYMILNDFTFTIMGAIPDSFGPVSIIDNGSQVAFCHSTGWHFANFSSSTIAPVVNAPIDSVASVMDNYVLFTIGTGGEFGITALADLSSIDPLDVASAEGAPSTLVSLICDHRETWLFCQETIEIWSDTGAAFFPFERSPGGFIEQGCAARRSPTKIDNSVFWLGRDKNGQGVVYRANAYIPQRISTHAIEFAINQYDDISDAIGFSYQEEGHSFYWLIFPSGDASWVYDVAAGGWHQRLWLNDFDGTLHRPRANCIAFFNGMHLVGDYANGKIYQLSLDAYTDDGVEIYRERAFDLPDSENKKLRIDFLELVALSGDGATISSPGAIWAWDSTTVTFDSVIYTFDGAGFGVDLPSKPLVWLQISRDAGRRFGYRRVKALGSLGETTARARWRHGGAGRDIVLRFGTTMASRVHWKAVNMRGSALG